VRFSQKCRIGGAPRLKAGRAFAISLVWFAAAHLLLFWEIWRDPLHLVPGPIGDNTVMLWNLGWVRYALNHGSAGFWFPNAYYPQGFLFLFGTHTWLDGALGWMAQAVLPKGSEGIVLWANIMELVATSFTGAAIVFGLWQWGARQFCVVLLTATAATFCWFRMFAATGHYHFFGTEWMALSLALLSAGRRRTLAGGHFGHKWSWYLAGGLLLGLALLNDQTMFVFGCALALLIWISIHFEARRKRLAFGGRRSLLVPLLAFWGAAFAVSLVHLVPLIVAAVQGKFHYQVSMYNDPRLVDASSLVLPNQRHLFSSLGLAHLREKYGLSWSEGTYFGIAGLLLLGVSCLGALKGLLDLISRRKSCWTRIFWITASTIGFLILALGDRLEIGRHLWIYLPGYLLHFVPAVNNIRIPQRWVWPAHLCNCLAASLTLSRIWQHQSKIRSWSTVRVPYRNAMALTIAAFAIAEGKWYPPARPVDIRDPFLHPAGVEAVRRAYRSGGVLTMPMEWAYGHSNVFQFLWGYDIPVVTAYTARAPYDVTKTPWHGTEWTKESGPWLRDHKVTIVIFSFQGGNLPEYKDWIANAKLAVPGLLVFNKDGKAL